MRAAVVALVAITELVLGAAAHAAPAARAPAAAPVIGVVSHVTDGDSLWVVPAGQAPREVRLRDIDAPEICQPGGVAARQALTELALGKRVEMQVSGHDGYGRTLAALRSDGIDLGTRLVEAGHAWSVRSRYDRGPLVKQERMAKALGRGLHATAGALPPWDFRRAHGTCSDAERAAAKAQGGKAAPAAAGALPARAPPAAGAFSCDGRTRCAEMRSCAEARDFLAHCPRARLDGDRNGVPCERQHCGSDR